MPPRLAKETEFAAGCVRVRTPHLASEKMHKTSGHLPYYAESIFLKMETDEHRTDRKNIKERIAELEKNWPITRRNSGSLLRLDWGERGRRPEEVTERKARKEF